MRVEFGEFYRPTAEQFKGLWEQAVLSFDANALLDCYRFSIESREELLKLMTEFRDRIWITHQAGLEFHENRLAVIDDVHKATEGVISRLEEALRDIDKECKQHPYLSTQLADVVRPKITEAIGTLTHAKAQYPDLVSNDTLGAQIAEVLKGHLGKPFPPDRLPVLNAEIDARIDSKIPPGYMDAKTKSKERARGDGLVWYQLMDYAKANQKSVIFITRDTKEDWWLIHKGKTLQPRPELRREFRDKTGQEFYAYTTFRFIEVAQEMLGGKVSAALVREAKQLADRAESKDELDQVVRPDEYTKFSSTSSASLIERRRLLAAIDEVRLLRSRVRRQMDYAQRSLHILREEQEGLEAIQRRGDELSPLQQDTARQLWEQEMRFRTELLDLRHELDRANIRYKTLRGRLESMKDRGELV